MNRIFALYKKGKKMLFRLAKCSCKSIRISYFYFLFEQLLRYTSYTKLNYLLIEKLLLEQLI